MWRHVNNEDSPRKKPPSTPSSHTVNQWGMYPHIRLRQSFAGVAIQTGCTIGPMNRDIRWPEIVETITTMT